MNSAGWTQSALLFLGSSPWRFARPIPRQGGHGTLPQQRSWVGPEQDNLTLFIGVIYKRSLRPGGGNMISIDARAHSEAVEPRQAELAASHRCGCDFSRHSIPGQWDKPHLSGIPQLTPSETIESFSSSTKPLAQLKVPPLNADSRSVELSAKSRPVAAEMLGQKGCPGTDSKPTG